MSQVKKQQKFIHWTKQERVKYQLFLLVHSQKMLQEGYNFKKQEPFKKLSIWMGNKTSEQCRDHHQKRLRKEPLSNLVDKIIRENYIERSASFKHFQKELRLLLEKLQKERKVSEDECQVMLEDCKKIIEKHTWGDVLGKVLASGQTSYTNPTHETPLQPWHK